MYAEARRMFSASIRVFPRPQRGIPKYAETRRMFSASIRVIPRPVFLGVAKLWVELSNLQLPDSPVMTAVSGLKQVII